MRTLLLLAAAALPSEGQSPAIDKLSFLSGCWAGGETEEMWTKPLGGTMMGLSRTVRGENTVFTEFLQISMGAAGAITLNVQLRLAGKATAFRVTELTNSSVVFSNPEHDYPQRITYRRQSEASLVARIEGSTGGKDMHEDFKYARVRCGE
jgi:hypothetical protein